MTLIACLHPRQCRTLFADVLIGSKEASNQDFTLPTRAYIAPDWFESLSAKPFTYRRKVIEITPQLVILWSGDYLLARQLAMRARDWFTTSSPSEDDVRGLWDKYYGKPIPGLHAIIVPASGDWLYNIGVVQKNQSPGCGEYFVAGTGAAIFTKIATKMIPSEGTPEHEALRIASEFMAYEFLDGGPIRALFGGAYEILYVGEKGFQRVDDVMHIFRLVQVVSSNQIKIIQGHHVIRQWYSGSQLCIGSLSSPDAEQQQLGNMGISVPDILEEPKQFIRSVEELAVIPKYMCIHHLFDFGKNQITCPMTIQGSDLIERHFKITSDRSQVRLAHTAEYEERVLQQAKQLANREP